MSEKRKELWKRLEDAEEAMRIADEINQQLRRRINAYEEQVIDLMSSTTEFSTERENGYKAKVYLLREGIEYYKRKANEKSACPHVLRMEKEREEILDNVRQLSNFESSEKKWRDEKIEALEKELSGYRVFKTPKID